MLLLSSSLWADCTIWFALPGTLTHARTHTLTRTLTYSHACTHTRTHTSTHTLLSLFGAGQCRAYKGEDRPRHAKQKEVQKVQTATACVNRRPLLLFLSPCQRVRGVCMHVRACFCVLNPCVYTLLVCAL
jgi:hypothetical protein